MHYLLIILFILGGCITTQRGGNDTLSDGAIITKAQELQDRSWQLLQLRCDRKLGSTNVCNSPVSNKKVTYTDLKLDEISPEKKQLNRM